MNNYEKIKNMTFEELAEFLGNIHENDLDDMCNKCDVPNCDSCNRDNCYKAAKIWLLETI